MSILIAYNLEKYRKLNKLTQRQLSNSLEKVSKSSIALYEKNQRTPSQEVQEQICNKLNITVDVLNGKNEIDYFTGKLKIQLLDSRLSINEYHYIYKLFINFFNNSSYFSTNFKLDSENRKKFKQYLHQKTKEDIDILSKEYVGNSELYTTLIKDFYYIFNVFIAFVLLLNNKEKIEDLSVINTKEFFKTDNDLIDDSFIKTFIELKPTFIQILDILTTLDEFKKYSLPIYYEKLNNIVGYTNIEQDLKDDKNVLFAIKVNTNFMNPRFEENNILILKQNEAYKSGQYVAIIDENENIFIGKLNNENDFIILQPLSLEYTPIILQKDKCKFIGEVIEVKYIY